MAEIIEEELTVRVPEWMRALSVIAGIIAIITAIIVLIYPAIAVATLVALLATGLLLIGIDRLVIAVEIEMPGWMRALDIIVGISAIVAAIINLIYPAIAVATLVALLATGLLLIGIERLVIAVGIEMPGWMRALSVIAGIIAIIMAIIVLIYPAIAVATLVALLATGLLLIGIERLVIGISGIMYSPVAHRRVTTA
jgi:uncharacterized membrane protein HdeD (DUF308 family)